MRRRHVLTSALPAVMAALIGIGFTALHITYGSPLAVILVDAALYAWVAVTSSRRLLSAVGLLVLWPSLFLLPLPTVSVGEYTLLLPILGGVSRSNRRAWLAYSLASLFLLTTLTVYRKGTGLLPASLIGWTFFLAGAWALALLVTWIVETQRRAHEQMLTEYRLALTRDLHDKISSQLALIANHVRHARATGAEMDPDLITATADDAIDQIRILLHHLQAADEPDPAAVAPTLQSALEDASRRLARAGFKVTIADKGDLGAVPASVASVAAPIVYEAVTNVIRHGDPKAPCTILTTSDDDATHVTLTNAPRTTDDRSDSGFGITSMRERAAVHGGRVDSAPSGDQWETHIALQHRDRPIVRSTS